MKLNQVIAIEKGTKQRGNTEKSELYKLAQKPTLFYGFIKKYRPILADGEKFPDEKNKVQATAPGLVEDIAKVLERLFDVEATKDFANCVAKADLVVDGATLIEGCPTTFLLYLEKELTDLGTFIGALPTLSDDEEWKLDAQAQGIFKTEATVTIRTKKVQKPIVLYPATPEHPAQTQLITEDEAVGYWDNVKMSGAITSTSKKNLAQRVQRLLEAAKSAREQANMVECPQKDAGKTICNWIFAAGQ